MKKHIQKIALLASALFVTAISTSAFAQTAPAKPAATKAAPAKPADKVVGKDAKGNDIYEGPKGGRYTINAKGAKTYIKPAAKPATTAPATTPAPKK